MRPRRWGAIVSNAAESTPVDGPAAPSRVREFAPATVAAFIILSCARPGIGFLLPLWLPVLLVWFVRMIWLAWRRPARRRAQGVKALALIGAMAIAALAQGFYQRQARERAQHVVDIVAAYRTAHGAYPVDLAQAGLDAEALRREWHIRYFAGEGEHRVMYADSFTVFDSFGYELEKPGWVFHAD